MCGALTGEDEADERLRGDGADNLAIHAAVGPLLPEQVDVLGAGHIATSATRYRRARGRWECADVRRQLERICIHLDRDARGP